MVVAEPAAVRRLAYLGTPALAVPTLLALHEAGYEIPVVVSRADKRRGRGNELQPSPVKAAALDLGIPVTTRMEAVVEAEVDLAVVVAFGRLIPAALLDQLVFVNLHFSLLPRWRGAAPVERALLAGDEVTGVCVMRLEEALDTGPVYRRAEVPITSDATLDTLRGELVEVGTDLLLDALDCGLGTPEPQVGEPTFAPKVDPAELELDLTRPAVELDRLVRLGGAWTTAGGRRLKIWQAHRGGRADLAPGELDGVDLGTGSGSLHLVEVQPEGKPRMAALAWVNGARLGPGARLG